MECATLECMWIYRVQLIRDDLEPVYIPMTGVPIAGDLSISKTDAIQTNKNHILRLAHVGNAIELEVENYGMSVLSIVSIVNVLITPRMPSIVFPILFAFTWSHVMLKSGISLRDGVIW